MVEWTRITPWRQGHVLPEEAVTAFGLVTLDAKHTVAVVISHDCDLAADLTRESTVEIIVGHLIEKPNGNFEYAKNARVLHVSYTDGDKKQTIELLATEKRNLPKQDLAGFIPRSDLQLNASGRSVLQRWLAARYRRAAFSDAFEMRLKKNGLDQKLSDILKPVGADIRAIYFDVDDEKEVGNNPSEALPSASDARVKIESAFKKKLFDPTNAWKDIELCACDAISDESLSVAQSMSLRQWRLEHLSLRVELPQAIVEE